MTTTANTPPALELASNLIETAAVAAGIAPAIAAQSTATGLMLQEFARNVLQSAAIQAALAGTAAEPPAGINNCILVAAEGLRMLARAPRPDAGVFHAERLVKLADELELTHAARHPESREYLVRARFSDGVEIYLDVRGAYDLGTKVGVDVQLPGEWESPAAAMVREGL